MKNEILESTLLNISARHIIFEPGDCTRYEFLVFEYNDIFKIISLNTFPTPDSFDKWMLNVIVSELDTKEITIEEACDKLYDWKKNKINPNTILQYARAIYKTYHQDNNHE